MTVEIVLKPFVLLKKQKLKEVTYSIIATYNLKDYILLSIALSYWKILRLSNRKIGCNFCLRLIMVIDKYSSKCKAKWKDKTKNSMGARYHLLNSAMGKQRASLAAQMVKNLPAIQESVSSVAQSCLTLCHPIDCSMPDFPVHHQLPELAQTHVHRVGEAIHPSHPLSSLSPPAFNLSQPQGLFQWVSSSHQVAKVLEFQLPMNIQDWFPLGLTSLISLQAKGLSRVFSNTTQVQSLGWEDALEKEIASYSSILSWRIPQTQELEVTKSQTKQSD